MTTQNFDTCTSFYLENGAFMGRFVRLKHVLKDILKKHQYPVDISRAVSQTTALAVVCSAMLKFKGLFTLQIQGNGPVSLLVTDVLAEGKVRSCAKFDVQKFQKAKTLRKTQDVIEEVPHLVGGGYMALTVDEQNGLAPYQGVVDLKGKNLTELALRYFQQSEQVDTLLKLFVQQDKKTKNNFVAGALILQKVPIKGGKNVETDDEKLLETWEDAKVFIDSLKEDEVFDFSLSDKEILHRLFHANKLEISSEKIFKFGCRCSREKLKKTLSSFDAKELDEMCDQKGQIEATCNFCGQTYSFERCELITTEKVLQ